MAKTQAVETMVPSHTRELMVVAKWVAGRLRQVDVIVTPALAWAYVKDLSGMASEMASAEGLETVTFAPDYVCPISLVSSDPNALPVAAYLCLIATAET